MNNNALTREEVFDVLSAERDYQNTKWGILDESNTPLDFLVQMHRSLFKAMDFEYNRIQSGGTTNPQVFRYMSHVAAIAVAALEKYGAPRREGF